MKLQGTDFFKSVPTTSIIKKREQHVKKTLQWANQEFNQSYEEQMNPRAKDVEMKDETAEAMAGFKKASTLTTAKKRECEDFSFMKRKVRVNLVENEVKEYKLEQDEIDAKKRKGKKY